MSTSTTLGFALFWIVCVAIFLVGLTAFEIWYKDYDGFWDWWYSEIDTKPSLRRKKFRREADKSRHH